MRFNVNRLATLAGIKPRSENIISEAGNRSKREEGYDEGYDWYERDLNEAKHETELDEDEEEEDGKKKEAKHKKSEDKLLDEIDDEQYVEINERDLVAEIRRFKKEQLEENALRQIIDEEVANVLDEMNLNSGWMYGNKKPSRSKRGSISKGFMGIGFK